MTWYSILLATNSNSTIIKEETPHILYLHQKHPKLNTLELMLRRMATHKALAYIAIAAIVFSVAYATDPTQLQDFCVATNSPSDGCKHSSSI